MDTRFLEGLDDYFCANYSDYVKLSALEGYEQPEVLYITQDGNVARRDPSVMRLCYQKDPQALLARFKDAFTDTEYTFSFSVPSYFRRMKDKFRKVTFAKLLKRTLERYDETAESAGARLDLEPRFWKMIVKGKLYPEKSTVLALALTCHMKVADMQNLLTVCEFELKKESVRDVVVSYLMEQKIFNEEMRDRCLAEYKLTTLPIRKY